MTDGLIGVLCGNYRVIETIDTGTFFEVYKAEHIELPGRFVATRILIEDLRGNSVHQARLKEEVKKLAEFDHDRIVKVVDFEKIEAPGSEFDQNFFVHLEYMPNGSLKHFMLQSQVNEVAPISEDRVLEIAEQSLEGLIYVHNKGGLHLDIHVGNLLFDENWMIKLADFGLAKWKQRTGYTQRTGTDKTIIGRYDLPELKKDYPGQEESGAWSDILYLGNTLSYLISRFDSQVNQDSIGPRIEKTNPNISADLIEILKKSVQDLASDRYQTAEEMLDSITGLKKSRSLDSYVRTNYLDEYRSLLGQSGVLSPSKINKAYDLLDQAEKKADDIPVVREMHKLLDRKSVSDFESIDSTLVGLEDNKNKNASKKVEELGEVVSAYRNIGSRCKLYKQATDQITGWR